MRQERCSWTLTLEASPRLGNPARMPEALERAGGGGGEWPWKEVHGWVGRTRRVAQDCGERVVKSGPRLWKEVHGVVHGRGERLTESTVMEGRPWSRGERSTELWREVHGSRSRVEESGAGGSRSRVVES
eukprot:2331330-Rhodomonas_salina.1